MPASENNLKEAIIRKDEKKQALAHDQIVCSPML
jgi:hypothetical protein